MYLPKHFALANDDAITAMQSSGVAQLVTLTSEGLFASTLPLLFVPPSDVNTSSIGFLHGHVARGNPQWKESLDSHEALVLFECADAYVSPSAYPSKAETGKVVPTWNYVSIHAYGTLVVHDDREWTRDLVRRLTEHHETIHADLRAGDSVTGRAWSIEDAPSEYIDSMLSAIVGIEIVLTRVQGKAKLSQNKSIEDATGVVNDLRNGTASERAVAALMPTARP